MSVSLFFEPLTVKLPVLSDSDKRLEKNVKTPTLVFKNAWEIETY